MSTETDKKSEEPQFSLQKIYIKDLSFESPNPVEYFSKPPNQPQINLQLSTEAQKLDEKTYEVILNITVTATPEDSDKTVYLVELKQAGLFTLNGFSQQELAATVNSFCPNILFPYAREAISSAVEHGGFPQLLLAPINFDALYQQHLQKTQTDKPGANLSSESKH